MGLYRKILIAADGSDASKNALRQACSLVRDNKSWMTVLTVIPYYQDQFQTLSVKEKVSHALKDEGEKILAAMKNISDEEDVYAQFLLKEGNPVDMILDTANDNSYDLIIMGRVGKSRLERALVGSVTSHVLGHSKKDILVVPENTVIGWKNILVAIDGARHSAKAARKALDIAKHYESSLTAVSIVDVTDEFQAQAPEAVEGLVKKARKYVMDFMKKASAQGIAVKSLVREGEAFRVITELAKNEDTELVVMGNRGRTGVKRLFMGSVTVKVIGYSPCPVLVAKV